MSSMISCVTKRAFSLTPCRAVIVTTQLSSTGSTRPPHTPKGRFDDKTEADLEAVKEPVDFNGMKIFVFFSLVELDIIRSVKENAGK